MLKKYNKLKDLRRMKKLDFLSACHEGDTFGMTDNIINCHSRHRLGIYFRRNTIIILAALVVLCMVSRLLFIGEYIEGWNSTNGMQSISDVLTSSGVDLTGWTLISASGILDDGLTIVGNGRNPSGYAEAWVAYLGGEPIPEPATISLLGIGLAGLAGIAVRRKFIKKRISRQ